MFFSFGARRPEETLRTQELIARLGLTVRALLPGFNEYLGAGVLAGTSNLFHLRTTAGPRPADHRRLRRPAVHRRQAGRGHPAVPVRGLRRGAPGRAGRPLGA